MPVSSILTKEQIIDLLQKEKPCLKSTYHVNNIAIFGSHAKGIPNDNSDIDIFVELDGFVGLKFVHLAEHLEALLGRKVDIITTGGLNSIRHKEIADNIKKSLVYA